MSSRNGRYARLIARREQRKAADAEAKPDDPEQMERAAIHAATEALSEEVTRWLADYLDLIKDLDKISDHVGAESVDDGDADLVGWLSLLKDSTPEDRQALTDSRLAQAVELTKGWKIVRKGSSSIPHHDVLDAKGEVFTLFGTSTPPEFAHLPIEDEYVAPAPPQALLTAPEPSQALPAPSKPINVGLHVVRAPRRTSTRNTAICGTASTSKENLMDDLEIQRNPQEAAKRKWTTVPDIEKPPTPAGMRRYDFSWADSEMSIDMPIRLDLSDWSIPPDDLTSTPSRSSPMRWWRNIPQSPSAASGPSCRSRIRPASRIPRPSWAQVFAQTFAEAYRPQLRRECRSSSEITVARRWRPPEVTDEREAHWKALVVRFAHLSAKFSGPSRTPKVREPQSRT